MRCDAASQMTKDATDALKRAHAAWEEERDKRRVRRHYGAEAAANPDFGLPGRGDHRRPAAELAAEADDLEGEDEEEEEGKSDSDDDFRGEGAEEEPEPMEADDGEGANGEEEDAHVPVGVMAPPDEDDDEDEEDEDADGGGGEAVAEGETGRLRRRGRRRRNLRDVRRGGEEERRGEEKEETRGVGRSSRGRRRPRGRHQGEGGQEDEAEGGEREEMNLTGSRPRSSLVSRTSRHARVIASGDPAGALSASPLRSPSRSNPSNAATMAGAIVSLLRNRIALRWPPLMSLRSAPPHRPRITPNSSSWCFPTNLSPSALTCTTAPSSGIGFPLSPPRLDQPHDLRQAQALHRRRQRRLRIVQRVPVLLPQFHRAASLRLRRSGRQHRPEIRGGVRRCLREDVPRDAVVQRPVRNGVALEVATTGAAPTLARGSVASAAAAATMAAKLATLPPRLTPVKTVCAPGYVSAEAGDRAAELHDARADLRDEAGN